MSNDKLNLEIKTGQFKDIFTLFNPSTIQHSDELTDARREEQDLKEELRNTWFWTADGPLYNTENKEPTLYLTRLSNNLVFRHFPESVDQIFCTGNYTPDPKEAKKVTEAEDTLVIPLRGLNFEKHDNNEFGYFKFPPLNHKLNKYQRRLVERAFGQDNFERNMKMLSDADIKETRIWILNPNYVKEKTKKGVYIARVARLYDFADDWWFYADGRCLGDRSGSLRGGIKSVAEGSSKKISEVSLDQRIKILDESKIKDPSELRKALEFYNHNKEFLFKQ